MEINWSKYNLTFQALSPLSIGFVKLGFVKLTRHYIPAKNIWAATVQYITEKCFPDKCESDNYKKVEEFVNKNIRFSYFFLKFNEKIYQPKFIEKKGLVYGDEEISLEEFQSKFIYSYASTAIEPLKATAQEDMLHEVEYINHQAEYKGEIKPVYFSGHLWIKEEIDISASLPGYLKNLPGYLTSLYENISLGGEKTYGFGRLKLIERSKSFKVKKTRPFEMIGADPVIKLNGLLLEAHMSYTEGNQFTGSLEPIVGREWDKKEPRHGAGRNLVSSGNVYLSPGTKLKNMPLQKITLSHHGHLKF